MEFTLIPDSIVTYNGTTYAAADAGTRTLLSVQGDADGFEKLVHPQDGVRFYLMTPANAKELRRRLGWLTPRPIGLGMSMGFGDRLGLATPGHIRAVRSTGVIPIFAQQSVRENARTGRTPQQVLDDAMWGVFQGGWREPWGADADHLKSITDISPFVSAGYTFYTVDPGAHVGETASDNSPQLLNQPSTALGWDVLEDSPADLDRRYLDGPFELEGLNIRFTPESLQRAVAKYGRALVHTIQMYQEIYRQRGGRAFDFEVSVDETDIPTTIEEHFYFANELARLGIQVTSLAPRLVGRFEKGVDYIGDPRELEPNLSAHACIARHFGYKISLHSGSDKLSVYPILARTTSGLAHVKTAGTSYLEALRTIALVRPKLFRDILTLACDRYAVDRASYHVTADTARVTRPSSDDTELALLLDQFDARQVLHVTFGSALAQFGNEIRTTLREFHSEYATILATHFGKHFAALKQ